MTLHTLGLRAEEFKLARATLDRIDRGTPRYDEIALSYNSSKPPGFRDLPGTSPSASNSRTNKKKNKR